MLYKNVGDETRVWPGILRPDGSTLELEPGATADLTLPDDFEDTYLKPDIGGWTPPVSPPNDTPVSVPDETNEEVQQ
jgi:hypothetical protein